jgi:structural maintenance of chromosome 2
MSKRAVDLTKELDESEKEYQVCKISQIIECIHYNILTLSFWTKFYFTQGVLAGKSSANEKKCLEDQLRDAKAAVGEAESGLKQLTTKISHSEKELKEKKTQMKSKRDEATAAEKELKARTKDLEAIKAAMGSINYEEGQMEALQKVCKKKKRSVFLLQT